MRSVFPDGTDGPAGAEWRASIGNVYPVSIFQEEAPVEEPVLDNTDPPITGGARILNKGEFPEWWKKWEEPQPEEVPLSTRPISELIAEAASELKIKKTKSKPKPRAQLRQEAPAPAQLRQEVPAPRIGVVYQYRLGVEAISSMSVKWEHERNHDIQDALIFLKRRQDRRMAALLLLKLLD